MSQSSLNPSYIPRPLRDLPWPVLLPLLALVLFGATVLWSAAGGHFAPYAWKHIFNFVLFMGCLLYTSRCV